LAGFAATALVTRRGIVGLIRNRVARVGLPLMLAMAIVCPVMHLLFATHSASRGRDWIPAECGGWVGPNFHLWFLYYLLLCCAPLIILLVLQSSIPARLVREFDGGCRKFLVLRWKIPVLAAAGIPVLWDMEAWWIDTPCGWMPDVTIFLYYLG